MNGFFKSRAFGVLITLFIILAGVPTILIGMGQGSFVHNGIAVIFSPLMRGAAAVGNSFRGFADYFTEFDRLKEENEVLSDRVRELEEQLHSANLLESENEWMRSYLGAKRANIDYTYCDANLIGSEAGKYISTFTLDRGSTSGIETGMPVVTDVGIVGRVTEVGLTFCRVSTVINYDSSVGAYIERSGEVGIISGDFDRRRDGLCVLEYLPFDADVEVGDRIVSSGLGSVYPRGLLIGTVTEVTSDATAHTKIAVVKPSASLEAITKVMILTSYSVE
ncbi:MAG: rod shape-determining protein MreC [Clostridia bacterium]|nr:rod shape-determining protein MreC [Clostridia bacterium]